MRRRGRGRRGRSEIYDRAIEFMYNKQLDGKNDKGREQGRSNTSPSLEAKHTNSNMKNINNNSLPCVLFSPPSLHPSFLPSFLLFCPSSISCSLLTFPFFSFLLFSFSHSRRMLTVHFGLWINCLYLSNLLLFFRPTSFANVSIAIDTAGTCPRLAQMRSGC